MTNHLIPDAELLNTIGNAIHGYGCMLEDHSGVVYAIGRAIVDARAAAQVGAKGAADQTGILKECATWLSEHEKSMLSGRPFLWNALQCNDLLWRVTKLAAAGAPAETPKPDERITYLERHLADMDLLARKAESALMNAGFSLSATGDWVAPAATIGVGEGKDALDAARYRWLRRLDNGACVMLPYPPDDMHVPHTEALDAAIDAAMRSKTSPGEAG